MAANCNYGPKNTGEWFSLKQEAVHRFCDEQPIDHGGLQELLDKLAAEQRLPADTREQQQRIFSNLRHMKSFCEKGPCAKLKRFMAPLDSWELYKDEMWGIKLIFEEISESRESRGNHENDDDGVVEARWHKEQNEELGKLKKAKRNHCSHNRVHQRAEHALDADVQFVREGFMGAARSSGNALQNAKRWPGGAMPLG